MENVLHDDYEQTWGYGDYVTEGRQPHNHLVTDWGNLRAQLAIVNCGDSHHLCLCAWTCTSDWNARFDTIFCIVSTTLGHFTSLQLNKTNDTVPPQTSGKIKIYLCDSSLTFWHFVALWFAWPSSVAVSLVLSECTPTENQPFHVQLPASAAYLLNFCLDFV